MDKQFTKKTAGEYTTEEKVATFDRFHEMASTLFDGVVKVGMVHPDDQAEVMMSLMDLLGDGANEHLSECVDEIVDEYLQEYSEACGGHCGCDCGCDDEEKDPEVS